MSLDAISNVLFIIMFLVVILAIAINMRYGRRADRRSEEMKRAFLEYLCRIGRQYDRCGKQADSKPSVGKRSSDNG